MSKNSGDLRAMAKLVAEKQIEINRLNEFQDNDRKTIRNLRKNLKDATEDLDEAWQEATTANEMRDKAEKELEKINIHNEELTEEIEVE